VCSHWVFQGVLALFPIKLSRYFSSSHHYVLCICRHGTNMSQKLTFGCVMSVPSPTRFCTMSATCRPTFCQHVGHNISCLSFWTSGQHTDIRHSQLSRPTVINGARPSTRPQESPPPHHSGHIPMTHRELFMTRPLTTGHEGQSHHCRWRRQTKTTPYRGIVHILRPQVCLPASPQAAHRQQAEGDHPT